MPSFKPGNYVLKSTRKRRFTTDNINKKKSSKRLKLKTHVGGKMPTRSTSRTMSYPRSSSKTSITNRSQTRSRTTTPKRTQTRSRTTTPKRTKTQSKSLVVSKSNTNLKLSYNQIDLNIFKNLFSNIINIKGLLLAFQNNEVEYLKQINKSVNQKTFLPIMKNSIMCNINTKKISVKKLSNIIDISFELIKKFVLKNRRSSQKGGANPQEELEEFIEAPVPALEPGQRQGGWFNFLRNMIDYLEGEDNDAQIIKAKAEFYEDNFKKYVEQAKKYNELSRKFRLELEAVNQKKIEDLNSNILGLKGKIKELDDVNNKNLGLIENLRDGQARNKREIEKLRLDLAKKIGEIRNLEGQLNDLNAKLNQCNIDGKNKAEQIQSLKDANEYLNNELKRVKEEISGKDKLIDQLNKAKESLQNQLDDESAESAKNIKLLQKEKDDLDKELKRVKEEISGKDKLIDQLNKAKESLQNQLDDESAKSAKNIKQLEQEKYDLNVKIQDLMISNNHNKSDINALLKKIDNQVKAITGLEDQLDNLGKVKENLEGKNSKLEDLLKDKEKEKNEMNAQLNKELDNKNDIINGLENNLRIEGNKNNENLNNIEDLKARLLEAINERDKLKNNSNTAQIQHVNETIGGLTVTPSPGINNSRNITQFVTQRISYDNVENPPQVCGTQDTNVSSSPLATLVAVGVVAIIGVLGYNYLNNTDNNKEKEFLEIQAELEQKQRELETNQGDNADLQRQIKELEDINRTQLDYKKKVEDERAERTELMKEILDMKIEHTDLVQKIEILDREFRTLQLKDNTLDGKIMANKRYEQSLNLDQNLEERRIRRRRPFRNTEKLREDLEDELTKLCQSLQLLRETDLLVFNIQRLNDDKENRIQDGQIPCVNDIPKEEKFNGKVIEFLRTGKQNAEDLKDKIVEHKETITPLIKEYKEKISLLEEAQKQYEENIVQEILRKDQHYRSISERMNSILEENERFKRQAHNKKEDLMVQVEVLVSLLNGQGLEIETGNTEIIKELLGVEKYEAYIKELEEIKAGVSNADDVSNISIQIGIDLTNIILRLVNDIRKLSRDNLINAQYTQDLFELFSEDIDDMVGHPLLNYVSGDERSSSSESNQQPDNRRGDDDDDDDGDDTIARASSPGFVTGERSEFPPDPPSELGQDIREAHGLPFQRSTYTLGRLGYGPTESREEFESRAVEAKRQASERLEQWKKENPEKKPKKKTKKKKKNSQ